MKNVIISDVSLKEKVKNGSALSFKEKLEIAKRLAELNVDIIELGLSEDKTEEVLIKTICACVNKSVIACVTGYTEESVEKSYSLLSGAKKKRLIVSVPVSAVHMEYFVSKKPKAVLDLLKQLTEKATSLCEDVEVSLEDATRADSAFLYLAVSTAIEAGAKTVNLSDIAGTMMPDEFFKFISDLKVNVPDIEKINLTVQCADDFSLATANCLSALSAGVNGIKLSALGGTKLPDITTFMQAMDVIGVKKGFSFNLNKTGARRILKQISSLVSLDNKGADFSAIDKKTEDKVVLGSMTAGEFNKTIKKMGYDLSAEDLSKVYKEFLRLSEKKPVNVKELDVIIANTALQVPATYILSSFTIHSSNVTPSMASVILVKDGKELSGLSYGNGSIDAAFLAIENIMGRHFELDEFEIGAVTEGKEAMGQTVIKLRANGKVYFGKGVSTDIVGAGIRAYVNAINKIVYEENNQ